ncbi:MAG: hypothetical protein KBA60_01655 [Flavobacteriales bacterium]|nr:hypothetical protein [Flavobacteriales bacterium]MBP7154687.1 hypothetical protein [Flavobacteriales bacterium]HQV73870.1 hypothetical protein [Flavobacteriales bacterium]
MAATTGLAVFATGMVLATAVCFFVFAGGVTAFLGFAAAFFGTTFLTGATVIFFTAFPTVLACFGFPAAFAKALYLTGDLALAGPLDFATGLGFPAFFAEAPFLVTAFFAGTFAAFAGPFALGAAFPFTDFAFLAM